MMRSISVVGSLLIAAMAILLGCSKKEDAPAAQLPATQIDQSEPKAQIAVTSPDFAAGGNIPEKFTSFGANDIPQIKWTAGPAGTRSYVLLLEDPDAPGSKPFVHWLIINIPAKTTQEPGAGMTLNNENGQAAYYGPRPPAGAAHHYHFQIFALDRTEITAVDRDSAIEQMKGHVLGKGELVALYKKS